MNVDGVICNEHTNYSTNGPRTSLNLYVFDVAKISPPIWVCIPDNRKSIDERSIYERDDVKNIIKKVHEYPYPFDY